MSSLIPSPILLTRVRNACMAGHRRVDMPGVELKVAIATILRDNHYVQDFKVLAMGARIAAALLEVSQRRAGHPASCIACRRPAPALRQGARDPAIKNGLGMAI